MTEYTVESSAEVMVDLNKKKPIRVLHVDDEPSLLKIAKQCLEMEGQFQVVIASSAEEAMEKMKEETYDAIVCDYQMPGKDGLEFLKELRTKGYSIPLVIFTGKGREEVAIKALNLGADGYYNKSGAPETVYGELAHGIRQVVESERAADALRESQSNARTLFENLPQKIFFKDRNSVYISCNENYARDLRIKADEVKGRTDFDFYPKELAEKYRADDKRIMETGSTEDIDEEYVQDGQKGLVRTVKTPVKDEKGNVTGVLGFFWDITGRKNAEEELRRFSTAVKTSLDGIITGDLNGNITDVNDAILRMYGDSNKGDLIGKNVLDFIVESDRAQALQDSMESMRTGQGKTIEYRALTKNGTEIPIEITTAFIRDEQGEPTGFVDIVRNIAERKKAEEQIRDNEEQLSQLFMRMPSGVAVYIAVNNGEDFVFTDFNEAAERIEHVSKREIIGKCVTEVFPGVKDFGVFEVFQRVWRTGQSEYFPAALYKDDKDQGTWRESWIYKLPNGSIVAIYNDITQRKKAEEKLKENSERIEMMNEKLRVVGGLTRHDVRNKLSAITGNIYLNKKRLADHPDVLESYVDMESACEQIVRIFDFAKDYEMLGVEELVYVDVEKVVNEDASFFSDLRGGKVANECHGLTVLADSLLRQLFYNLIDNSLKYGERPTRIRIHCEKTDGDQLKLVYEDDGIGISLDAKPKIFDGGYTTGKGSDYGLYLVKKMMEVYGWTIQETGTHGKGAQFTINIPKAKPDGRPNYKLG